MVREGMRGADQQQNHIFSYVSPEERVRKASAAPHPHDGGRSAPAVVAAVGRDARQGWATVDSAGTTVASAIAANAVLDSQRTAADGTNRLQHATSPEAAFYVAV